jgi:hypothetical protein
MSKKKNREGRQPQRGSKISEARKRLLKHTITFYTIPNKEASAYLERND